jgi:hypothetical protein
MIVEAIAEAWQTVIQSFNKSLLVVLLVLGAMAGAETVSGSTRAAEHAAGSSGRHSRSPTQEIRRLQARVESAYVAASREFADDVFGTNVPENPIYSARSEWQVRIARCGNEGCRRALLTDELRRLRFPFQTSRQRISHTPWRTGVFRIEYRDGSGGLQVLPIIDDLVLIRADSSERRRADWICDLTAYGRIRANGTADMKMIGENVRFTLSTGRRGEIVLRPIVPEPNGHAGCPPRGSLWGTYRPHHGR